VQVCVAAWIANGEIVHVDALQVPADVSCENLVAKHVGAAAEANRDGGAVAAKREGKQTGRYKKDLHH
jgi:hypothetical protein